MSVSLTVGGWFAQAFIQTLFDKASDEAIRLFAERRGFAEDMEKLRTSLLETQIILDVALISLSNDTKCKTLMQELKDAAYDAEDLIDEFQYHVLRQKVKGEEEDKASGSSGIPNIFSAAKKKLFGFSSDTRARVREIQGRLERIANSMKSVMNVLPPNDRGKRPEVKFQARESCSSPATDILLGREKELSRVVEWLLGSANQVEPAGFVNDTFSVLPIVGIGGVGKTTLAQYVHKDNRVQDCFDHKIWICVSVNFTVQRLAKSIIQSVTTEQQYDAMKLDAMELEHLQKILHQHIAQKKFLLFLDDVWSLQKSIWEKFCSLLKVGAHGSKIIVTTRDMKVSKMVSPVEPLSLDGLDEDAFWQLFEKCSFGTLKPTDYPELEVIGRKIACKLKGSPLAAKTLGGVLQSDLCRQHWATILESDIWKVEQDEDGIMPALHLSYDYLKENLKQCFAFCSLFPEDYEFNKDKLVQMWMAEGFIEDKNTKRMEDVGSNYFREFVSRSFFQESEIGEFVMHDLIHDLAEMISAEATCRIENNRQTKMLSTTRHLRVANGKLPLEFSGYKLRTLVLINSPADSLFEKLRSIRILDVSCCGLQELSEHIGKLIHLRYLDISYNPIKTLPDSLCDLYNLQTLNVLYCRALVSIPQQLGKLVNLRHIDADDKFWVMLKDVRRLNNLQELQTFSVGENDDGLKLEQLKDLTQLLGTLHIQNLENVVDSKEAQRGELKNKVHLKELLLEWNDEKDADMEEEVIESLQPHKSLKSLYIKGYNGARSPTWLMPKILFNLEKLELERCVRWDDVLPFVGQRLHLIELRMFFMPALKQLSHAFVGKCFPKLEVLQLLDLSSLEEWSWSEGKDLFPCMRELRVILCPKLKTLPPFPPSLEILVINDCPKLILNSKTEDDEESVFQLPLSLKVLELNNCGEYAKLMPDCLHNLHLVTRLEIIHCPNMTSIPLVQLVELQWLYVSNCDELRRMECLELLKSLKELKIVECPKLDQLECLHNLGSVTRLEISHCPYITAIPLVQLVELQYLHVSDCDELRWMEGLELLKSLKELKIVGCPKLVQLAVKDEQVEGSLSSLRKLCVDNTALFKMFPLRNSLPFITRLDIKSCSEEVIFEEEILVRSLTAVKFLAFSDCMKLQSLPTELLHNLPFLEDLKIWRCPQIQSLPEKGLLPTLRSLDIFNCPQIQAMPEEGLPMSLIYFRCFGNVHPTLKEQAGKFMADRKARLQ